MVKTEKHACHQRHYEPDQSVSLFCCYLKDLHRDFLNMAKIGYFRKFFENRTGKWVYFLNRVWGGSLPRQRASFPFLFWVSCCSQAAGVALCRGTGVNSMPAPTHSHTPLPRLQLRQSRRKHTVSQRWGFITKVEPATMPTLRLPNAFHKNTAANNQAWPLTCTRLSFRDH